MAEGGSGLGVVAILSRCGCSTVSTSDTSGCRLDRSVFTSRQNR